jgi:glycosyltransferase involved in cell wall biosynthesis
VYADMNSSKKVILHIITGLSIGGAEMMLYKLLTKTNRMRFEPIVVSLMDRGALGDRIAALDIPVHTIDMKTGIPTPAALWQLVHIVRQIKPDLIQGWMYHGILAAQVSVIFSSYKIPVVWNIHHSIYSLALEKKLSAAIIRLSAWLSKLPSKIVFVSQISQKQHEALGYHRENSCVIPNGSDISVFKPSFEARLSVREELSLPENTFLIGLICRYHPMKDHANFLRAAEILLKDYPDTHFLLAGTGVDKENQELRQLIKDLSICHQTHLLGERIDIPRLSAALDIASSASAYGEAFPMILGEAMACGVPCVVTDVGDSGWIVSNTGRVVPPKNPEALARAWKELIELDSETREAISKAARDRIVKSFSLETVVTEYENLYENILTKQNLKEFLIPQYSSVKDI